MTSFTDGFAHAARWPRYESIDFMQSGPVLRWALASHLARPPSSVLSLHFDELVMSKDLVTSEIPRRPLAGLAMVVFASLGGTLQGYDTGTINGILQMRDWLQTFGDPVAGNTQAHLFITTAMESVVVSILSAGTLLGP